VPESSGGINCHFPLPVPVALMWGEHVYVDV
jgi:hypothetical protein